MKHLSNYNNYLVEKIVKISDDFEEKAKEAYDLIKTHKDKWLPLSGDMDHPYFPIQFRNFLEVNNMRGQRIKVHIGVFNADLEESGIAGIDTSNPFPTILINLNGVRSLADFTESIEHELIHLMDPKVMDTDGLADRMWGKYGIDKTETEEQITKYYKSPWEFDAYSTNIINHIKRRLKAYPVYRKKIWELMSAISKKTTKEIIMDYDWCVLFLSSLGLKDDWREAYQIAYGQLRCLKIWSTKPTLWKKFLQRLHAEIG